MRRLLISRLSQGVLNMCTNGNTLVHDVPARRIHCAARGVLAHRLGSRCQGDDRALLRESRVRES